MSKVQRHAPVRVVHDTKTKTKSTAHPLLGRMIPPEPGSKSHSGRPVLGRMVGGGGHEGHVMGRIIHHGTGKPVGPGHVLMGRVIPQSQAPKGHPVLGRIVDPHDRHPPAVIMGRIVSPGGKHHDSGHHVMGRIAHPGHFGRPHMGRIIPPSRD